jgi:hypothetical protein
MSCLRDGFDTLYHTGFLSAGPSLLEHSASTETVRSKIADTVDSHTRCDVQFPLPVRQFIKLHYNT